MYRTKGISFGSYGTAGIGEGVANLMTMTFIN